MKCPDRDVLAEYAEGNIADSEQKEQIKKHIESCQKCQNLLRSYTMFQKDGHDEHHKPHEIHVSGENDGIVEEYEAELGEKFSGNQIRNIKIAGIAITLLVMMTIFGIFIWQSRHKEASTNIANIGGMQYRIWKNADFSAKQVVGDIQNLSESQGVDNYMVFLTPKLAKILYQPKMNSEFWRNLAKLLRDQNIPTPSKLGILLIENDLFSDIGATKGSLSGDISVYFCKDKAVLIQWARD